MPSDFQVSPCKGCGRGRETVEGIICEKPSEPCIRGLDKTCVLPGTGLILSMPRVKPPAPDYSEPVGWPGPLPRVKNDAPVVTVDERFRRATALIQLLINSTGDDFFEVKEEARAQLKEWGINVPDARHP